jgi:AraC-like DNA-binding protein
MGSTWVPMIEATTDAVPPAQRIEYWESHNASELIGLRCTSYATDGLQARQRNFDLGSLRLAEISGNEHVVERTLPIVRSHPKDSIFACMLLQGEAFFYQAGRCVPVREGDLIVYTTTLPYLYGFTRAMRQVQVDIDAAPLVSGGRLARPIVPVRVEAGLRAGRMLAATLRRSLLDFMRRPLADDAAGVATQVRTLLEALLVPQGAQTRHDESSALRLLRAEAFIVEHLADLDLDAERVARHVAVSPRHLNRLFEKHDSTLTDWIWQQRLARAHACLADPAQRSASIGDIAMRCGFATQAHFARQFRRAYGMTPTQHRLLALAGAGAAPS